MWNTQAKTAVTAVVVTCLVLLMVDDKFTTMNEAMFKVDVSQYHSYNDDSEPSQLSKPRINETGEGRNRTGILFDSCVLRDADPWDVTIKQYFKYGYNPLKDCDPTVELATQLQNGKLYVLDNRTNVQCWWRCLYPKNDYKLTYGVWEKIINGTAPECDVIETNCRSNELKTEKELKKTKPGDSKFKDVTFYEFLHAQTFRKNSSEAEEPKEAEQALNQPDVHIILFDSVSESQFIRSMPKTRHYLREYYDAISFRYLNKVGANSRPNGIALLLGKTLFELKENAMSVGYKSDFFNNSDCNEGLENDQFIGFQYQDAGYKTLISEDWARGVFNWPNCWGFKDMTPADHYMRPYQLRVEDANYRTKILRKSIYQGVCRDSYAPQMEYLKDMLDTYPDKPKFSITWMSYLAHDNSNGLFHADDYFYNFIKNNNEKLNNSYLFIMGDHGMRFGTVRKTPAGEREDNNPFLFMTLPGSLRSDSNLVSTIRYNAHQLTSHYDLYATLADIVAPHQKNKSRELLLHGASVLKPLPQPRTCDRLRIPFEFCICENTKTKLPENTETGRRAATIMVKKMNEVLLTEPQLKGLCAPLTLSNATVTTETFKPEGNLTVIQVTYKVQPGDGQFWGYLTLNTNSELKIISSRFARLDSYSKTAFCAKKSAYAGYCYCKELFRTTTTTKKATTKRITTTTGTPATSNKP